MNLTRMLAGLALGVASVAMAAPPAAALVAAEMVDLPQDHWAFKAIQSLMEKYGVMEGFPDRTFRGAKTVSRYELAAALTKVMARMDAAGGAPPPAADTATVGKLKGELAKELEALDGRIKANEDILKQIQDKVGKGGAVKGSVSSVLGDETLDVGKDRTAPFIATSLSVSFKGNVSESTTYDATIGGAIKAGGSGDVPAAMSGIGNSKAPDTVSVRAARFTTKLGATTVNVGRFPLWLVGFGPSSDQAFRTGDFVVGVGATGPDASSLRVGSDVGTTVSTELGPLTLQGGLNSNIVIGQLGAVFGPVGLKLGYETDHKAITQSILTSGTPVKTADNAAVVLDLGGEGPIGASLQANMNKFTLTQYGGGVRGSLAGFDLNVVANVGSDPGKKVDVLSYCLCLGVPSWTLPLGGIKTPTLLVAGTDNYTITAPNRPDGKTTVGPGGVALGKNAGVSVQVGIDNPIIPNLVAEYNVQAKLIEHIFVGSSTDPITSETLLFKSSIKF